MSTDDTTEQALARREAELRLVTDAVPALISFIGHDHRYRMVNRAYEAWFGRRREEMVGRHLRDVLGEEAYQAVRPRLEAALAGELVTYEAEVRYRTGGTRWIEATYTPHVGPDGKVEGLIALVHDLTERRRSEELVAAGREHLRQVVEHTPAPVAMLDRELRYLVVSRRWYVDYQVAEPDIIGKRHDEVFPDLPERWREIHRRCLAGAVERAEVEPWTRADGSVVWVKWEIHPWRDETGAIGGIVIYSENVTERKRAEEELREREVRFRALADNIAQLAWMADEKGWIFWYNKRWFDYTGTTLEEMQGWGWRRVHHPDHVDRVVETWSRALAEGRGWDDTFPLRGKEGSFRWFLSRAFPIHDQDGRVLRWFGTNTDVTEQRAAADALQEAVTMRDAFLSIASHELKTPLTPLTLQLQAIARIAEREGGVSTAVVLEKVRKAEKQVLHLDELVHRLLDVSRLVAGRPQLTLERLDLGKLVGDVVERLRPAIQLAECPLSLALASGVTGSWDPLRLDQVVSNLLGNAIKYGRAKPVEVSVEADEGAAVLRVRDHGIGITPADQERIFGRFERAVSERSYGGFGLGLWIARQLVEAQGGTIEVESAAGRGATFTVRLPTS